MLARRDRAAARSARLPGRAGAAGRRLRGDGAAGTCRRSSTWSAAPIRSTNLTAEAFESVLQWSRADFRSELSRLARRVVWDRIHNRLTPLPGTAQLALVGGGTIPDTGQYPVYLGEGGPRLGELDEEFVYERRVGETFVLGNADLADRGDRARIACWSSRAAGQTAVMPFWRGESAARSSELGEAVGALSREVVRAARRPEIAELARSRMPARPGTPPVRFATTWRGRQRLAGAVPDDRTILVETFIDPAGELEPGRAHARSAGSCTMRSSWCSSGDPPAAGPDRRRACTATTGSCSGCRGWTTRRWTCSTGLTAELAERLIREELPETALFGLRFRQNAAGAS